MQQITRLWQALTLRNRIIVIGAAFVMFWAVLALARMASTPSMTLLYAGLESSAASKASHMKCATTRFLSTRHVGMSCA